MSWNMASTCNFELPNQDVPNGSNLKFTQQDLQSMNILCIGDNRASNFKTRGVGIFRSITVRCLSTQFLHELIPEIEKELTIATYDLIIVFAIHSECVASTWNPLENAYSLTPSHNVDLNSIHSYIIDTCIKWQQWYPYTLSIFTLPYPIDFKRCSMLLLNNRGLDSPLNYSLYFEWYKGVSKHLVNMYSNASSKGNFLYINLSDIYFEKLKKDPNTDMTIDGLNPSDEFIDYLFSMFSSIFSNFDGASKFKLHSVIADRVISEDYAKNNVLPLNMEQATVSDSTDFNLNNANIEIKERARSRSKSKSSVISVTSRTSSQSPHRERSTSSLKNGTQSRSHRSESRNSNKSKRRNRFSLGRERRDGTLSAVSPIRDTGKSDNLDLQFKPNSEERQALVELMNIHLKECDIYRKFPHKFENYEEEKSLWVSYMENHDIEVNSREAEMEWEKFWMKEMNIRFEANWRVKKKNLIEILRNQSLQDSKNMDVDSPQHESVNLPPSSQKLDFKTISPEKSHSPRSNKQMDEEDLKNKSRMRRKLDKYKYALMEDKLKYIDDNFGSNDKDIRQRTSNDKKNKIDPPPSVLSKKGHKDFSSTIKKLEGMLNVEKVVKKDNKFDCESLSKSELNFRNTPHSSESRLDRKRHILRDEEIELRNDLKDQKLKQKRSRVGFDEGRMESQCLNMRTSKKEQPSTKPGRESRDFNGSKIIGISSSSGQGADSKDSRNPTQDANISGSSQLYDPFSIDTNVENPIADSKYLFNSKEEAEVSSTSSVLIQKEEFPLIITAIDTLSILKQLTERWFVGLAASIRVVCDSLDKAQENNGDVMKILDKDAQLLLNILKSKLEVNIDNPSITPIQKTIYQEGFSRINLLLEKLGKSEKKAKDPFESLDIDCVAIATNGKDCIETVAFLKERIPGASASKLMELYLEIRKVQTRLFDEPVEPIVDTCPLPSTMISTDKSNAKSKFSDYDSSMDSGDIILSKKFPSTNVRRNKSDKINLDDQKHKDTISSSEFENRTTPNAKYSNSHISSRREIDGKNSENRKEEKADSKSSSYSKNKKGSEMKNFTSKPKAIFQLKLGSTSKLNRLNIFQDESEEEEEEGEVRDKMASSEDDSRSEEKEVAEFKNSLVVMSQRKLSRLYSKFHSLNKVKQKILISHLTILEVIDPHFAQSHHWVKDVK